METKQVERDYLFDNMKAFLVTFVIIGHLIVNICPESEIAGVIYTFIYLFHMPVFVFVTGYFSKNVEKCREKAVQKYLVPYFVFCILLQIESRILNIGVGANLGFNLLYPQWGMWYMIALFWWKLFIKDLCKLRFILPMSIALGLLSGFSREFTSYLALGRTVNLLFFFLLGYFCTKEHIEKLRDIPKALGLIPIALTTISAILYNYEWNWPKKYLYLKKYYVEGAERNEILARILVYVMATTMIFAFISLCSKKKKWYTYVGTNSVSVYILHLFLVKIIERFYPFEKIPVWLNIVAILVISIAIAFFTALPVFSKTYEKLIDLVNRIAFKKDTPESGATELKAVQK